MKRMPSNPLLGMPVAVGMSAAVIPMRSVVSACADRVPSKAAASASVQTALRISMISPIRTVGPMGEKGASFRPAANPQPCAHALLFGRKCLRRAIQMRDEAGKQAAAVGAAHDVFDVVFRMRHHAQDIAALVDDARDRMRGA